MDDEYDHWTEPLDQPMPPPAPPPPQATGGRPPREPDRTLLVVVGIVAALALGLGAGAVVVVGLGGHDTTTITTVGQSAQGAGARNAPSAGAAPLTGQSSAGPTFRTYRPSDSTYAYTASVPSGDGWSAPAESYPTSGELLRTTLRRPNGALLVIDRTPSEVPQLGGGYLSSQPVYQPHFGSATEYVFSSSNSISECDGSPCVDFLINDGSGGGWGVLAGGPDLGPSKALASRVASSISDASAPGPSAASPSTTSSGSSTAGGKQFSGSGSSSLGTVTVSSPSTLSWTDTGGGAAHSFSMLAYASNGESIDIFSQQTSGTSQILPGTYHDVQVIGDDSWSIRISPG